MITGQIIVLTLHGITQNSIRSTDSLESLTIRFGILVRVELLREITIGLEHKVRSMKLMLTFLI